MAKSLRSKRKRKFRAIKRLKLKPKLDAKLREIALKKPDSLLSDEVSMEKVTTDTVHNFAENEIKESVPEKEQSKDSGDDGGDVDMDEDSAKPKKSSKNAKVPLHLLSQRKLRKFKQKQKDKNIKKKNKFLKW